MRKDSTGLKLEMAFGCLIALLVGVGWLGLSRMGQLNVSTSRLFEERAERFNSVRQASSYVNANYRATMQFFLTAQGSEEELSALAAQVRENDAKIAAYWKRIEAEPVADAEKEIFSKIKATKAPADESLQKLMNMPKGLLLGQEGDVVLAGVFDEFLDLGGS